MTKHPEKRLTLSDMPVAVAGAARYTIRFCLTGGVDVVMIPTEGLWSCVDHKPTEQAAFRSAIRLQKRENAAVTKAAKTKVKA